MVNTWNVFSNNTALEVGVFCGSFTFVLWSLALTGYHIFRHIKHWTDPGGQRSIVRILFLVAVYSAVSWLAIVFGDYALYFTLVRDCYEAYALYQFFALLVHYVKKEMSALYGMDELDEDDPGQLLAHFGETGFPFPFCMLTYQPGRRVFAHMKRCSLQYVFVKPTLSLIAILLQLLGLYHPGSLSIKYGYFWIAFILNVSAAIAVYFIFLFYELIEAKIRIHRPLLKLISIKILVFFIFWQSMIIAILYYFHVIPAFFGWSVERSSETVQNLIICIEMAGLSCFNFYAFPYAEYRTSPGENTLDIALESLSTVLNHGDMVNDTKEVLKFSKTKTDKLKD